MPKATNAKIGSVTFLDSTNEEPQPLQVTQKKPSDNSLHDQYTAELFYRLYLTKSLAITPDVQLIIDPALNPDEDVIGVFGLRVRLTF